MKWFLVAVAACALLPSSVHCASNSVAWCYHLPSCNYPTWPNISANFCNGSRQSPINIVPASAIADSNLTAFTFHNYSSTSALATISNTGKTVKVTFASGVQVSGGGLSEPYDGLQFHLHWGNGSSVPGSEHTVDGKRYPMELHIVNLKSSVNGDPFQAIADSTGIAALGFFIEEMEGNATASPASWKTLTSYLTNITEQGQSASIAPGISLDDLLDGVDRTMYYRYLGSLTTPTCNEAVVWTVFKGSIKVSKDLIDLFSNTVRIGNSTTDFITNPFRGIQPSQRVTTQATNTTSGTTKAHHSLGLMFLGLMFWRG